MDVRYFKSLLCLYTEQNLQRASAKLYISSQGLSKQIQALEDQLGLKLFERSSVGMRPTAFCDTIYPVVKNICDECDKLEDLANRHQSQMRNTVTIVIPLGVTDVIRMDTLYELRRHFPDFQIVAQEFESEECKHRLLCGKADIAFLTPMTNFSMLDSYEFRQDGTGVIVNKNHPLVSRNQPLYVCDLYDQKLYRRIYRKTTGDFFRSVTDPTKYDCSRVMTVGYDEETLLAVTGEGACVLDVKSTLTDITHPDLVVLDVLDVSGWWIYCCTNKDTQLSKPAKQVLEYLLHTLSEK